MAMDNFAASGMLKLNRSSELFDGFRKLRRQKFVDHPTNCFGAGPSIQVLAARGPSPDNSVHSVDDKICRIQHVSDGSNLPFESVLTA